MNGPSGMVFEHIWDYFHLEDSMNEFLQLFWLSFHIAHGHIPPRIGCVLGATCFLAMIKSSNVVCSIIVGKHCIDSQATLYVFNFAMFLQHIFTHTNLELQLRVVVKQ